MSARRDVKPGDRFNSLTIIEEIPKIRKRRRFKCRCDCGNVVEKDLNNIANGSVKTCGRCNYKPIRIGDKFGHWTVIEGPIKDKKTYHKQYLCECDCKNKTHKYVDEQNLKRGLSSSCGCATIESAKNRMTIHGQSKTRLFVIWVGMRQRCFNPNVDCYERYGGRGITVCEEWKNSYETFRDWALSHGYKENLTIDRIDVNGNYEPSNCRWATNKEQSNNRRSNLSITYQGENHNVAEWAEILGINRETIASRYKKGYPIEDVFFIGKFKPGKRS